MSDLIAFQHFHFMRPYWLLALIVFYLLLRKLKQRDDALATWRKLMSAQMFKHMTVAGSDIHWLSPRKITALLTFLICIVLAGPTWQQQPSPFTEDKSALIIALDVSATMTQKDVQPSRLLRAKQKINELLAYRGDANTALVAYAGTAHTVMPITNDSEMIRHFIDVLEEKLMPKSGKAPQDVLPIAEQLLTPTEAPGTILLLTDGASDEAIAEYGKFFATQPHQLVVWAIGETERSVADEIIPVKLDKLSDLADASNGRLVTLTHDKQDIAQVDSYIKNNLVIVDDASTPWHDAGYPLLVVISILYLLWFRRGWTLQW